jgi:hypothetical protein
VNSPRLRPLGFWIFSDDELIKLSSCMHLSRARTGSSACIVSRHLVGDGRRASTSP